MIQAGGDYLKNLFAELFTADGWYHEKEAAPQMFQIEEI